MPQFHEHRGHDQRLAVAIVSVIARLKPRSGSWERDAAKASRACNPSRGAELTFRSSKHL